MKLKRKLIHFICEALKIEVSLVEHNLAFCSKESKDEYMYIMEKLAFKKWFRSLNNQHKSKNEKVV